MNLETLSEVAANLRKMPNGTQYVRDRALKIIMAAEKDLGPLTHGQRRDLLADNTEFSLELCYIAEQMVSDYLLKQGAK